MRNVASHFGFPRNVSEENMDRPGEVQKCPKNNQNWRFIIHAFGLFRGPSSERRGIPPRDMGGHWKGVMWLRTNMWMHLRSFQGNLGFHEKYTLSDFPEVRAPNATRCLLETWESIGNEVCGLEWIHGCLYVHFETILGFKRNEQMGCLEAYRGNANCAKHPRNVTSH